MVCFFSVYFCRKQCGQVVLDVLKEHPVNDVMENIHQIASTLSMASEDTGKQIQNIHKFILIELSSTISPATNTRNDKQMYTIPKTKQYITSLIYNSISIPILQIGYHPTAVFLWKYSCHIISRCLKCIYVIYRFSFRKTAQMYFSYRVAMKRVPFEMTYTRHKQQHKKRRRSM